MRHQEKRQLPETRDPLTWLHHSPKAHGYKTGRESPLDGGAAPGLPEGVEGAHVQHGEQFCFGFGEGQAVVQGLKCRHDESCLPVGQLQLLDGVPVVVERV